MRDFRKYEIWSRAIEVVNDIYSICDGFPKYELYAMSDQIRRAAVSIPSNIAEGASRTSTTEFSHYLEISMGSAFEVETQLLIAKKRGYLTDEAYDTVVRELRKIERQLNMFIEKMKGGTRSVMSDASRHV